MISFNFQTQQSQDDFLAAIKNPTVTPVLVTAPTPTTPAPLFLADFTGKPDGLVTSEYAYWNPSDTNAKRSPDFEMTSGSLFSKGGKGWTGVVDEGTVDIASVIHNNSRDFRLTTKRKDFKDISVKLELTNIKQSAGIITPAKAYDGIHIFMRYLTQYDLYYCSINRRDGTCIIKKKRKDGPAPANGGTYTELTKYVPHTWTPGVLQNVRATAKNQADGTVLLVLYANGSELVRAIDDGKTGIIDGSPGHWGGIITSAGATGIRGDNTEFLFNNLVVTAI